MTDSPSGGWREVYEWCAVDVSVEDFEPGGRRKFRVGRVFGQHVDTDALAVANEDSDTTLRE